MGRDAVARADGALMDMGLLDCNLVPQEPPEGWFRKKKTTDPGKHWRHGYTSWTKYVPRPGCRMSLLTICCWSYIAHCAQSGWTPRSGLGASYLCRVLRAHRTSVQKVMSALKESGLVQRHDGSWCPVLVDLDWLADKWDGTKSAGGTPKVRWVELPEGETVTVPTEGSTYTVPPAPERSPNALVKELFFPLMKRAGVYTLEERQAIVRAVLATPDWKEDAHAMLPGNLRGRWTSARPARSGCGWRVGSRITATARLEGVAGLATPRLVWRQGVAGLATPPGWFGNTCWLVRQQD